MEFRTVVTSGREVLRVGGERANGRPAADWLESDQLRVLQGAVLAAARRVGSKPRKPRDFDFNAFAAALELVLSQAPAELLAATPAL
jgi:hypothetical protein